MLLRALTALFMMGCAAPAVAQELPRLSPNAAADTVRIYFMRDVAGNRIQPEYTPRPIRIGNFDIRPQLQINTNFDGNWLNRADVSITQALKLTALPPETIERLTGFINPQIERKDDIEFDIDPQIGVVSDWASNKLQFDASARIYRYAQLTRENRVEYRVNTLGQIDFGEKHNLTFVAGVDRRAEVPGVNGTAVLNYFGFGPSMHTTVMATGDANFTFGRVQAQLGLSLSRDYYDDLELRTADLLSPAGLTALNGNYGEFLDLLRTAGITTSAVSTASGRIAFSQAFREDQATQVTANAAYLLTPDTQVYLQSTYQYLQQLHVPAGQAVHPFDSDTFGFLVGMAKSIGGLIVFQGGIGWQFHRYGDSYYQNTSRLNLQGAVDWYPTPLLSLRATAGQAYQGSAVYGVGDISVRVVTLRADYEILPNVEAWMLLSSEWDRYPIGAANAARLSGATYTMQSGNFEVDYQANRLLGFGVNFGFHRRLSQDPVVLGPFAAWRAGVTVTFRH